MHHTRRTLLAALASAAGLSQAGVAADRNDTAYPGRPITLVVPFSVGGTTDQAARALADSLARQLGKPVVIENRPGAGGSMGVMDMLRAQPDGHRLTLAPMGIFRQPHLQTVGYHPLRDLSYIATFMEYDFLVTVPADSPFRSVRDIVEYAAKHPGEVNYGTPGRYSGNHTTMAMLGRKLNLKFTHVPFKGDTESVNALMGGHLRMAIVANAVLPFMQSGRVRVLASAGESPNPAFRAPTLKELGYDVVVPSPLGVAGPRGLPAPIVETLAMAIRKAMDDPVLSGLLKAQGLRPTFMDSKAYSAFAAQAFAQEAGVVANLGMESD